MTDQVEFLARPAAWLTRVAVALVFAVGLSACDTADYTVDWFDDDDEEETAEGEDDAAEAGTEGGSQQPVDRPFPNLSSVPERPGPPEIKLEAVSVKEGLTADKNNARYTDEALRSQTANVRPRPRVEETAAAPAAASVGPTAADRAARPSAPPPPPPGTPSARRPPPAPPGSPAATRPASEPEEPAGPAQAQVAAKPPAVSPSSQPGQRPTPIGKEPSVPKPAPAPEAVAPAPETVARAAPAPAPEPVTQDRAPKRARPAPPQVAAATAAPAPAQPIPARAGTTSLIATIYFADGQTVLTAEDLAVLRQVMDIQRQGGGVLRVVGHSSMSSGIADPTRRRLANFKVSLDRATIVAQSFKDMGLPGDRVAVEALGDAQPIYSEETAAGAAGNRRAEIFLDF